MADTLGMAAQIANNAVRFGWYSGINWLMSREAQRLGPRPRYVPARPVPSEAELMADLRALFLADAVGRARWPLPAGRAGGQPRPPHARSARHVRRPAGDR